MDIEMLKHLRKLRGISQERLAEEIGVSRQTVYRWESGHAVPSQEDVENICHALGVDYAELAEEASVAETAERTSGQSPAQTNEQASMQLFLQMFLQKQAEQKKKKRRRIALIALCCLVPVLALSLYICGEIAFTSNKGHGTVYISEWHMDYAALFWFLVILLCAVVIAVAIMLFLRWKRRKKQRSAEQGKGTARIANLSQK